MFFYAYVDRILCRYIDLRFFFLSLCRLAGVVRMLPLLDTISYTGGRLFMMADRKYADMYPI